MTEANIWSKIDSSLFDDDTATNNENETSDFAKRRKWQRYRTYLLDPVSVLIWLYIFLQLFVFDVDSSVLNAIVPGHPDLKYYKIVIVVIVATVIVTLWKKIWVPALYIAFFPLVLIFWKLPRSIYKHKSAPLGLAVVNLISSVFIDLKWNTIAFAIWFVSMVVVLTIHVQFLVSISMALLFVALIRSYFRTFKYSFIPSRFVSLQRKLIGAVSKSPFLTDSVKIDDELVSDEVQVFSKSQLVKFTNNLGLAVLYNRAVYFWAHQLDEYCDGQLPTVFSALSYFWLFLFSVLTFSLINIGLLHVDATSFTYVSPPSIIEMIHYSVVSFASSSIPQVASSSALAQSIQIAEEILGPVLGITLFANVIYKVREKRQQGDLKQISQEIRQRGKVLSQDFETNYHITVREAITKLQELRYGLSVLIIYFDSQTPTDDN